MKILLLVIVFFDFGVLIHAQTALSVNGVELTIMGKTDLFVKGKMIINQSSKTSNGNTVYKDGEILNSGNIYISDSIINRTRELFYKTSNPYLTNNDGSLGAKLTAAGTVVFNGSSMQPVKSKAPNHILFYNMDINNVKGVKLNDSITALGKVDPKNGSMFLNGKNLFLFYNATQFVKYDGFIGKESNAFNIWDTTKVGNFKLLGDRRSGHIVAFYNDKASFDDKAWSFGIRIHANTLHIDTIQRGNLSIPYAGNGSLRKYYVFKTKEFNNETSDPYSISYLDSADFKNLHIKEPDFRLFLNQGKSAVTFIQTPGSTDASNDSVSGVVTISPSTTYVLTIADSACDNPPRVKLKAPVNVCEGVPFTVSTDSLSRTYSQMIFYNWYKNNVLINDMTNSVKDTLKSSATVTYKVKIYDNRGCFSYSQTVITSHAIPDAHFKLDDHGAGYCAGAIATFTDTSSILGNGKLTRQWYWSDGVQAGADSSKINLHTFQNAGTFDVALITTSPFGCSDTITKGVEVHAVPVVQYTAQTLCGDSALWVRFSNNTDPVKYPIYQADWKFGISDTLGPLKQGDQPSKPFVHQFASPGSKTVSLAINSLGCVSTVTNTVNVSVQTVSFNVNDSICQGNILLFQNNSTITSGLPSYTWRFGDGTESNLNNPQKTYMNDDVYNVTLLMQSDHCSDSITRAIHVNPLPVASFTSDNACVGAVIAFTPSIKTFGKYAWTIGGEGSTQVSPEKSFSSAGTFGVSLTVTSDSGCVATTSNQFTVYARPKAEFTFQNVCSGDLMHFYNQSSIVGGNLTYQWRFNDDDPTSVPDPTYSFAGLAGDQHVKLITSSNHNCRDTIEKIVQLYPLPVADLPKELTYCENHYTLDATVPATVATVVSYVWNNGTRQSQLTVGQNGIYAVDITSDKGCVVTESVLVTLNATLDAHLANDTAFCGHGTLDALYANAYCSWFKDGSALAVQRKLLVNEGGWYKVKIDDQKCATSDSVFVTINSIPHISLGPDETACDGTFVTLDAGNGFNAYHWSTGETTALISVNSEAKYKVTVTDINGCIQSDTIQVSYHPLPLKPMWLPLSSCSLATLRAGDNASSYLWSTGEKTNSIDVKTSGDYWVKISNGYACFVYDTINVNILHVDNANLGSDISVCEGNEVTLNAGNHTPDYTYLWNKQPSLSSTLKVVKAGRYTLTLQNTANGCSSSDTVAVEFKTAPLVNLGNDKALCNALAVVLDAGNPGALTQWGSAGGLTGTQRTFEVKDPGKYWVTVMNEFGCLGSDTIEIFPSSVSIVAGFIASSRVSTGDTVNFRDMSFPEPYICKWTFGDGVVSNDANPKHIFYIADTFNVKLTVDNNHCVSTISKPIAVRLSLKDAMLQNKLIDEHFIEILSSKLYPNPTTGEFTFEMELSDFANVVIAIYNLRGSLVSIEKLGKTDELVKHYNLGGLPSGIYIFKAMVGKNAATYKIIKQ